MNQQKSPPSAIEGKNTVVLASRSERVPGPTISINCPSCKAVGVRAETYEQIDHLGVGSFFAMLPLFKIKNTFVQCTGCGKNLIARLSTDELAKYPAEDVSHYLVVHVSIISKFLAILSILLFGAPIVGLGVGLGAFFLNRHTTGWPRLLSRIGLVLSTIITVVILVLLSLGILK